MKMSQNNFDYLSLGIVGGAALFLGSCCLSAVLTERRVHVGSRYAETLPYVSWLPPTDYVCGKYSIELILTKGGLSREVIRDLIAGIPHYKMTSIAVDKDEKIVDWDQYISVLHPDQVSAVVTRLRRQIPQATKVLFFEHHPELGTCLKCVGCEFV
jgi:hypothetical protein